MKGELYLLPNLLNVEEDHHLLLPAGVDLAVFQIDGLIAENEKEGRRFLKRFSFDRERTFRDIPITLFNKHNREVDALLTPLNAGEKWGLVSDAGLPVLADPGYQLVRRAFEFGIKVKAFAGPSAIFMGLMLSGLPAQHFTFHGYPPKELAPFLKSLKRGCTHLMIEAPFRNDPFMQNLIQLLPDGAELSIACDLAFPTQQVETHKVSSWKKRSWPQLNKRPTLFLVHQA